MEVKVKLIQIDRTLKPLRFQKNKVNNNLSLNMLYNMINNYKKTPCGIQNSALMKIKVV